MLPRLRTIPDEIVECIAEGRAPDIFELLEVAAHIERDVGRLITENNADNSKSSPYLRAARAALAGTA